MGTRTMTRTTRTLSLAVASASLALVIGSPVGAQSSTPAQIEVPLRVEGGRLVVPVTTADGETLDFLLTTGNPMTILTESTAARLGENPQLMLGEASVDTEDAYAIADASLVIDGTQFHGMVAASTLSRYDVLFDAPGGRLVLKDIGPRVTWPGVALSNPIGLRIFHGVAISLDITIDGHALGAMLDIGSSPVLVNAGAAATLGLDGEGTATVKVGDVTFPNTAVHTSDNPVFERWDPDGNGFAMIGASLAADCAIALSYVHQEMRVCAR